MKYVALLRGIMPTNPNMKGEHLRRVFEKLGFKNVKSVIASGNIVFASPSKNPAALEKKIEQTLPKELGFRSTTIIRSEDELRALIAKSPFGKKIHQPKTYQIVTFLKSRAPEICTTVDLTTGKTPDFMRDVEKRYGKEITTRTWNTVHRIVKKMEEIS
jgi:uncharacterized protein (DUF1697 family)